MQLPEYLIFYDGHCRFCTESKGMLEQMDSSAHLRFMNVRETGLIQRYPMIDPALALGQMHVLNPAGQLSGGFDAILSLLPAFSSLRVFHPLLASPVFYALGHKIYKWVARNRYRLAGTMSEPAGGCENGGCRINWGVASTATRGSQNPEVAETLVAR